MAHVFISYSRSDKVFVETLRHALADRGKEIWIDWQDIPPTSQWMLEIFAAIAAADAMIVVLSPRAAVSATCRREMAHAAELGKRMIPVVCEPVDADAFPESVRSVQWIDLTAEPTNAAKLDSVVHAIDADLEWVREHTRLLQRANEWQQRNRNTGLLLRGAALEDAQNWLARAAQKEPKPTATQIELIVTSRTHARRVQRIAFGAVAAGLIVSIALGALALVQRNAARRQQTIAESRELAARAVNSLETDPLRALLLAIEAGDRHPTDAVADILGRALELPRVLAILRNGSPIRHADVSPDGTLILTGGNDGKARLWKAADGSEVRTFRGHTQAIKQVTFGPSGREALTLAESARIWRLSDGRELHNLSADDDPLVSAAFSDDGHTLTTASLTGTVRLWDLKTGALAGTLPRSGGVVLASSAALSPVRSTVAFAEHFGQDIRFFSLSDGRELRHFSSGATARFNQVRPAFSPDGRIAAVGNESFGVRVLRTADFVEVADIPVQPGSSITSVSFRSDGQVLVGAREDGTAHFWSTTGQALGFLAGHDGQINHATFSRDGQLVVTAGEDGTARVWSLASGGAARRLIGHKALINRVRVSPDGKLVLTAGSDNAARIWEAATGREVRLLPADDEVFDAEFSPNGQLAVTGSRRGTTSIWHVADGRRLRVLSGHGDGIMNVVFSPNGKQFLTVGLDDTIRVWATEDGRELHVLRGSEGGGDQATYSSDGELILSVEGKAARLWRVADGQLVRNVLRTHGQSESCDLQPRWAACRDGKQRPLRESVERSGWAGAHARRPYGHGAASRIRSLR